MSDERPRTTNYNHLIMTNWSVSLPKILSSLIMMKSDFWKFFFLLIGLFVYYWCPVSNIVVKAQVQSDSSIIIATDKTLPTISQLTQLPKTQPSISVLTTLTKPIPIARLVRATPASGPGWSLDDKGILTITNALKQPTNINNKESWPWKDHLEEITQVNIKDKITNFTNTSYMFSGMTNLTSISGLDKLDVSNVTDLRSMFSSDKSLTTLDLAGFKVDKVVNFDYLFSGCDALTEIKGLDQWQTPAAESMVAMFQKCPLLKTLDLSHLYSPNASSKLLEIRNMFDQDESLQTINVSNFDVSHVQNFHAVFNGCKAVTTIEGIENWNTQNVLDMSNMFSYDRAIINLNVSKWDVSQVTNFSTMFASCNKLELIIGLDQWKTPNAENMSYMFANDESLQSLDVSQFQVNKVTDFSQMFTGCSKLTAIDGLDKDNWTTSAAQDMNNMFSYDSNLGELDLTNFDVSNVTDMSLMFAGDSALTVVNTKGFDAKNIKDFSKMFYACNKLKEITGIKNWKTPSAENMSYMFAYDSNLKSLNLQGFDISKVNNTLSTSSGTQTEITRGLRYMFFGCENLVSITGTDQWNAAKVADVEGMFGSCKKLQNLDLSSFNGAQITNMKSMFAYDDDLEAVTTKDIDVSNVTDFSLMFASCRHLQEVQGIENWHMKNATTIEGMFIYDGNLQKATLNNDDSDKLINAKQALLGCNNLQTLDLSHLNLRQADNDSMLAYDNSLWKMTLGTNVVLSPTAKSQNSVTLSEVPVNSDFPSLFPDDETGNDHTELNHSYITASTGKWQEIKSNEKEINPSGDTHSSYDLTYFVYGSSKHPTQIRTWIWQPIAAGLSLVEYPQKFDLKATLTNSVNYEFDNGQSQTYKVLDRRYGHNGKFWQVMAAATDLKTDQDILSAHIVLYDSNKAITLTKSPQVIYSTTSNSGIDYPWTYKAKLNLNTVYPWLHYGKQYHSTITYTLKDAP